MDITGYEYDYSLLPPHIITQILNNLRYRQILKASLTCKSWYFASYDPIITKRVRVEIRNQFDFVHELSRPFATLVMNNTNFNEFDYKTFFTKFGQTVIELECKNCMLSPQQLADCLITMINLKTFKIVPAIETFSSALHLSDSEGDALKPILNHLEFFSVFVHNRLDYDGLRSIMDMMVNLKKLRFVPYDVDTYDPFHNLISYANISSLNQLEIENLTETSMANFIRDFSKIPVPLKLNSYALRTVYSDLLRIRYYDENFPVFCKKLSNVQILSMQSVGEEQLVDICQYMPQLVELNLFGITTNKITIIGTLPNLRKLSLKHFNQVVGTDKSEMFITLVNLNDLEVDYTISDEVLNMICTNCKNLTRLDLSRMGTNNLEVLYKNLLQLKYLDLKVKAIYDPFTVSYDITNLKFLEHLNINSLVPGMSMELIEKLPNLKEASLRDLKYRFEASIRRPPMLMAIRDINVT